MNILLKLEGWKTYIFLGLTAAFTLIEFMIKGDYSLSSFIVLSQQQSIISAFAAMRYGIHKAGNNGNFPGGNSAKTAAVLLLMLAFGSSAYAQNTNTQPISISSAIQGAVQSVDVPSQISKIKESGLAVNTGFWYDWKAGQVDATFTYPVFGSKAIGSWGTWDYINFGYASPDVLIAGTGLDINVGVVAQKWGVKATGNMLNILNSASIGLTPMLGIQNVGGKNRFTGGPGGYVKITF